jgi:hypothetical protein
VVCSKDSNTWCRVVRSATVHAQAWKAWRASFALCAQCNSATPILPTTTETMGTSDDCPGPEAEPASPRQALATASGPMDTTEDFPDSTPEAVQPAATHTTGPLVLHQTLQTDSPLAANTDPAATGDNDQGDDPDDQSATAVAGRVTAGEPPLKPAGWETMTRKQRRNWHKRGGKWR